jgi:uncharacterized protein YbjT (DUF2867 family)
MSIPLSFIDQTFKKNYKDMKKLLIAGATGTLGKKLVSELHSRGYPLRILVRREEQAGQFTGITDDIIVGEVTKHETIKGAAEGIDAVISSVGITRQKDGLTYEEVDYAGNRNLLNEVIRSGAKHFVYIASLNGEKMRHLKMVAAKEKFVDELRKAPIRHTIARPNGFFSDLVEIMNMARRGRVYLPGNGSKRANPISTEDLARVVADLFENDQETAEIGGPEILTQNEIAELAFAALGANPKITYLPKSLLKAASNVMRIFTPISVYGPLEFFFTVTTRDMVAECYGEKTVGQFFKELAGKINSGATTRKRELHNV